jgi:hypothetical protein
MLSTHFWTSFSSSAIRFGLFLGFVEAHIHGFFPALIGGFLGGIILGLVWAIAHKGAKLFSS